MQNKEKKTVKFNTKPTQVLKLWDRDIETIVMSEFSMLRKARERLNMLHRDMDSIQWHQDRKSSGKKYTV